MRLLLPCLLALLPTLPLRAEDPPPLPRRVELRTSDRFQLTATFHASNRASAPGLVLAHAEGGSGQDWAPLLPRLKQAGYAILVLDLRGHGASTAGGKLDQATMSRAKLEKTCAAMSEDVIAAVAFLRAERAVDPARIALLGAGVGASTALKVLARDERLRGAALLSPGLKTMGVKIKQLAKPHPGRRLLIVASRGDAEGVACLEAFAAATEPTDGVTTRLFETKAPGPDAPPPRGTGLLTQEPDSIPLLVEWLAETCQEKE